MLKVTQKSVRSGEREREIESENNTRCAGVCWMRALPHRCIIGARDLEIRLHSEVELCGEGEK